MKTTYTKRVLALLLSLVVMLSMCLAGTVSAFAASGDVTRAAVEPAGAGIAETDSEAATLMNTPLSGGDPIYKANYSTITAESMNASEYTAYYTPLATSAKDFSYYITMPKAGTLDISYIAVNSSGAVSADVNDSVSGTGVTSRLNSAKSSKGVKTTQYGVSEAGTVNLKFNLYSVTSSTNIIFEVTYAPYISNTIKAPTKAFSRYYYKGGKGDNSTVSSFKISVPAKGYLALDLCDNIGTYNVYMKANSFGGYEYVSTSNIRRIIGVKKGTYTIRVKSYAPVIAYRVRLYPVTESKYGLKKSTAASMKKTYLRKGLIITDSKKTHWYKFKNPKLQKVSLVITTKINGGGNYGGVRVTIYDSRGEFYNRVIYPETASTTIKLYTYGKNNRLVKGTYKIRVQSYKSGNGYFSLKWK